MCTQKECERALGKWVSFRTKWGTHRGIVEEVTPRGALVRVPKQYVPAQLLQASDEDKLDVALTRFGYGVGAPGYRGAYGYGYPHRRWGYPGYGAWYGGWWWWWLAFAWIFWLAFLW
ncbi:hypothetical protein [Alicyclobacillus acidoterrestris]|uniref:Uncharacterized protein n=2 Tax=Alicyclobacillus acidoterrestris TaxID=1450 RepID=T0BQ67_ALIAG|nr:hypothetical protein [Alicyclobacillus acidoterrestris]EPZ42675.1 hypothetical protein N007_14665 [Alicyclobacillus acidoterrestris ATCC 49025]UNO50978.1 hypothetical protein K1I37_11700 [Alicyclobacillus acidoterrestris]